MLGKSAAGVAAVRKFSQGREAGRLLALGLMLSLGFVLLAAPSGGQRTSLVGTWHLTAPFFGHDAYAMVTYFKEGTLVHTGASKNNVNAHGVWKKVGRRTFVEQNREYVYQNEELAVFADTTMLVELAQDGPSWVGEAVTELKLLDGTVIDEVSFEVFGKRMLLDI
jgi:hypothetical protein